MKIKYSIQTKVVRSIIVWTILIGLLAACGGTATTNAPVSTLPAQPKVKIGYLPITHAAPLYIEASTAGYSGFELELVKFGSWPDLMDALNSGRIDGASVLIELAMKAKEQGIALKAVALGHKDGNVVITAPDIESVQDLQGKPFAIPHPYSTHNILLYQMLKEAGMAYEDVQAIQLPPAEMPVALAEGRISGYVVAEPFGAKAVVMSKGKVLYQSDELWPNSVDCALVLREQFIEEQRVVAEEFVHWYKEAGKLAEKNDDHVKEILMQYMNIDQAVLDVSLQWISYDELKIEEADYKILRQYMMEMGLSEQPPTYEQFVDNTLFDKVS
ncbi:ABC transporter substrate-binding protein [Paenibacillus yanchengensis]|uniref:ABC transporter substrate-binding protein n=1 Tax=Paenibacillus yanchengensis TaxID=2035833 RepID=A0ABW4YHU8_9BACL